MDMHFEDPAKIMSEWREKFVAYRAIEERKIADWVTSLNKCSEEMRAQVPADMLNVTLKDLVPEFYNEKIDRDVAFQQFTKANERINEVNKLVNDYNLKARELILQQRKLGA